MATGQITLQVKVGDEEHSTLAWMDFMVVRSTSLYNGIIGRPGLRKIQAVPSTAHRMIKLPVDGGTLTLRSRKIVPMECAMVSRPEDQPPPVSKVKEERTKVVINPEHTKQTVMISSNLSDRIRTKLYDLLQRSLDVFAWTPEDMTGVPRHIAEHRLNVREVAAGIMREVHYHDWLSNPVMVKKHDDSWRMCVDFKDLNKACSKDGYPLPEIDWKVKSLCRFPFKCFLDAYKGYHQIQIAEEDEEKTAFITNQGIFCYTKMPFGLRNAGATYQQLVDKAFHEQIGRNLEVYVDDLVIKSRTEDEVVRDIKETFRTLRKINMKLNPRKCTFGVEEGMFLGYHINTNGIKVCPDKVDAVLIISGLDSFRLKLLGDESWRAKVVKMIASGNVPNRVNYQRSQVSNNIQRHSNTIRPNDNRNRRTVEGSNMVCENCGFNGYTIDRCFKIIGYPPDFGFENREGSGDWLGHHADQYLDVLKPNLSFKNNKSDVVCNVCQRAKHTREPVPLSGHVFTDIGELVYLDMWGPYKVASMDVKRPLELKVSFQSEMGHIRGLEGDEEGLVDVLVKLDTSLNDVDTSFDAAARIKKQGCM
ncbi:reverse transcriptase domain-containing protein [Tanacetum coccineum]